MKTRTNKTTERNNTGRNTPRLGATIDETTVVETLTDQDLSGTKGGIVERAADFNFGIVEDQQKELVQ